MNWFRSGCRAGLALAALAPAVGLASATQAELLYATSGSSLSRFDSTSLGVVTTVPITNLQPGETITDIDLRPATGDLYAVGSASRLYTIAPLTGVATQVGSAGAFTISGTAFGMDF